MYALVRNNKIIETRSSYPLIYEDHDGNIWDLRPGQRDPAQAGWHRVEETEFPEDTATHTSASRIELVDGKPTRMWDQREWEPAELAARTESSSRIDSIEERLAILWAAVFPPDDTPELPDPAGYPEFDNIWHPDKIIRENNRLWRNVSRVPLTSPPSAFPGTPDLWGHLFLELTEPGSEPEESEYPQYKGEWSPNADYVPGDHVTRNSTVYKCIAAHGVAHQGTWGPPMTGVWVEA